MASDSRLPLLGGLAGRLPDGAAGGGRPKLIGPKGLFLKDASPLFGLENPGIVSIPIGFLAAYLGTVLSREKASEERYEELRVRALTGIGAEEAEPARAPARV